VRRRRRSSSCLEASGFVSRSKHQHAAMSGQYMFDKTMHLPVDFLYEPERSPAKDFGNPDWPDPNLGFRKVFV